MSWNNLFARISSVGSHSGKSRHRKSGSLRERRIVLEALEDRQLLTASSVDAAAGAYDFGDAPDSYGTMVVSSGAQHEAVGPTLGATRDAEGDGLPGAGATGDDTGNTDDEDGVTLPSSLYVGQYASATVNVQNASSGAKLDAWVDFDRDGAFEEAEKIANSADVIEGNNQFLFAVPDSAVAGETYARFRLSNAGGLGPTGATSSGEVEDYSVTIAGGVDLGEVDYREISDVDLSGGEKSYLLTASQAGTLTVDAAYDSAGGEVTLRLLDNQQQTLEEATGSEGSARVDYASATEGTVYILRVSGSNTNVDLRLCNLVNETSEGVVVSDTSADDSYLFAISDTYDVTVKGIDYHFDQSSNFVFNSTEGDDTIELIDSTGDDSLTINPEQAVLTGTPTGGTVYTATANGFAYVHGYAKSGGNDTAEMTGTKNTDRVKVYPDLVKSMGASYFGRAKFFETVNVDMLEGKNTAIMMGNKETTDVLWAKKNEMRVAYDADLETGEKPPFADLVYDVTVVGCNRVVGRAKGADDWVELHDSSGKDVLIAKPHRMDMMNAPRPADDVERGEEYRITARGFRNAMGIADRGGDGDAAKLYDSAEEGTDVWAADYVSGQTWSSMTSPTRLLYEVLAFEQVGGYGFNGGLGEDHGTNQKDLSAQTDFVLEYGYWQ